MKSEFVLDTATANAAFPRRPVPGHRSISQFVFFLNCLGIAYEQACQGLCSPSNIDKEDSNSAGKHLLSGVMHVIATSEHDRGLRLAAPTTNDKLGSLQVPRNQY